MKFLSFEEEQDLTSKSKKQEREDAISFYKQSKLKTALHKQLQRFMETDTSKPMEEESVIPK